jgi:Flp pilus assembly protein TadD
VNNELLKKLRERYRRAPRDPDTLYELGTAALAAGELEEGRKLLSESVALTPGNLTRGTAAAQSLAASGFVNDARRIYANLIEQLGPAIDAEPNRLDFRMIAAEALEGLGDLVDAAQELSTVLSVEPEHLEANRRLAGVLEQTGDTAGAVACWRRVAAKIAAEDPDVLTRLGIALSSDGNHDEAVQVLSLVVRVRGNVSSAHADLGMALLAARRLDEAVSVFSRARDLDPESPQAHCGLGLVYQEQKRWWEATEAFEATERLAPDNPAAPMNLAAALTTIGRHEEARAALMRAAALAPDDQEIRNALGQMGIPEHVHEEVTRPQLQADQFGALVSGDLATLALPDVLDFLRSESKSGSLVVSSRKGAGLARLVRGRISSAYVPGMKRLGESLVEQKLITVRALEDALARQRDDQEETLGGLLLKSGAIERGRLIETVWRQILSALSEMLTWKEGAFSFHAGEEKVAPPVSFEIQHILLNVAKGKPSRTDLPPPSSPQR